METENSLPQRSVHGYVGWLKKSKRKNDEAAVSGVDSNHVADDYVDVDDDRSPDVADNARAVLHRQIEFHRQVIEELEAELARIPPPRKLSRDEWLPQSVCELFPHDSRLTNMLMDRNILTVGDLLNCRRDELLAIPNFGFLNLQSVFRAMRTAGFRVPSIDSLEM